MALSAKQRNGIENAIEWLSGLGAVKDAIRHDQEHAQEIYQAVDILRDLLTTSKPAWEATEERKEAVRAAYDRYDVSDSCLETYRRNVHVRDVLRAMLDEVD